LRIQRGGHQEERRRDKPENKPLKKMTHDPPLRKPGNGGVLQSSETPAGRARSLPELEEPKAQRVLARFGVVPDEPVVIQDGEEPVNRAAVPPNCEPSSRSFAKGSAAPSLTMREHVS
jgi:hypothetical protein